VISFNGHANEKTLREALAALFSYCPVTGSRFCEAEPPFWEPVHRPDLTGLVCVHETDDPEYELRRVLAGPLDPSRGPPIRLDIVRSGTDTLCITLHHAAGDARALLDCTRMLAALYHSMSTHGEDPVFFPPCETDRSNDPYLSPFSQETRDPEYPGGAAYAGPWPFPLRSLKCGARDFAIRTVSPGYLASVRAYGKARSATVNEVLLAATTLAFRRFLAPGAPEVLALLNPLDLRRHYPREGNHTPAGDETTSACDVSNRSVAFVVVLPCDESQTTDSLVPLAARALREHREKNSALTETRKTERLASEGFTAIQNHVRCVKESARESGGTLPFFVNVGIIPESSLDFGPDLPVTGAFLAAGILTSPPGIVLTVSTFREKLTFSTGFCSDAISREEATGFLDAVIASVPHAPDG
jgi:Uncharacterized protein containing a NRPS condensation (elongation) domain